MRDQYGYGHDERPVPDEYDLTTAPHPNGKGRASAVDDAMRGLDKAIDAQTVAIDQLASLLEPVLGPHLTAAEADVMAVAEPSVSPLVQRLYRMTRALEYRTAALREMTGQVEL